MLNIFLQGCRSPDDHGLYVWRNYVKESGARKIAIKSHSAGGSVAKALYKKYQADFRQRVFVNAFTGDGAIPLPVTDYTKRVSY